MTSVTGDIGKTLVAEDIIIRKGTEDICKHL